MRVFLSWSGRRSREIAEILYKWLPQVIQSVDPWISSEMEKGIRWSSEIVRNLEESEVGIICLTRENINEPWILFEAGALSKTKNAHVCTFLVDLNPSEIKFPLAMFQHTQFTRDEIRKLVHTINQYAEKAGERSLSEKLLDKVFDTNWPPLEAELQGEPTDPLKEMVGKILEHIQALERPEAVFLKQKAEEMLELIQTPERPEAVFLKEMKTVYPEIVLGYTPIIIFVTFQILTDFIQGRKITEDIIKEKLLNLLRWESSRREISAIGGYLERAVENFATQYKSYRKKDSIIKATREFSREIVEKQFPEEEEYFDFLFDLTIEEIGELKPGKETEFLREIR